MFAEKDERPAAPEGDGAHRLGDRAFRGHVGQDQAEPGLLRRQPFDKARQRPVDVVGIDQRIAEGRVFVGPQADGRRDPPEARPRERRQAGQGAGRDDADRRHREARRGRNA